MLAYAFTVPNTFSTTVGRVLQPPWSSTPGGLGGSLLGQADSFALKVRSLLSPGVHDPSYQCLSMITPVSAPTHSSAEHLGRRARRQEPAAAVQRCCQSSDFDEAVIHK
jgi:hypothetical protein